MYDSRFIKIEKNSVAVIVIMRGISSLKIIEKGQYIQNIEKGCKDDNGKYCYKKQHLIFHGDIIDSLILFTSFLFSWQNSVLYKGLF